MAEALNNSFLGGDFDNLGTPLVNIVLNRLNIFWEIQRTSLITEEVSVESYLQ